MRDTGDTVGEGLGNCPYCTIVMRCPLTRRASRLPRAERQERAARASLYPSRGRDVMAAPKEAPGPLDTATGRTDHGGTRDQRTV